MNSLTAIRPTSIPELRPLPPAPQIAGSPKISPAELAGLSPAGVAQPAAPERSFGTLLHELVGEVNAKRASASAAVAGVLSGGNVSLHQAMIATEEASLSFQLMVEVRNRLLESSQELMRMQV